MAKIKSTKTGPELKLRNALWSSGLRYRLNANLPGRPDIVFHRAKLAVFVDGCFWHGCPIHGHIPKSNLDYWQKKLARTRERDNQANSALTSLGWTILRFWEHEIDASLETCVSAIRQAILQ
jgi:DNA mismatch endonuclease (patch repair protein)